MTAAQRLAEFATTLTLDDVPGDVAHQAKLHLLDTLGCGLAAHATGTAGEGRTAMAELGGETQATVIGLDARLPAPNAAFANAMLCHGLDFDDTHSDSVSHVSTVTCPSSLAVGEAHGLGGARCSRRSSPGTRRSRGSAWRHRAASTRAASTRPRSAASSAPPAQRRD